MQLHLKKHARDTGHTPSVKEMLRAPLPAIPPFKGAKLPEDSETTIPAVHLGLACCNLAGARPLDPDPDPSPDLYMGEMLQTSMMQH